jgi:hypothetical protein
MISQLGQNQDAKFWGRNDALDAAALFCIIRTNPARRHLEIGIMLIEVR